jgi:gallate decarboxylase subunit D
MLSTWSDKSGRISVDAVLVPMGNDLCVAITGGERPHLGAAAVAQVRPSLADPARLSATTSVITLLGHKENIVATRVAHDLAAGLNKNVAVACGIHVDNITSQEMQFVNEAIARFCKDVISSATGKEDRSCR